MEKLPNIKENWLDGFLGKFSRKTLLTILLSISPLIASAQESKKVNLQNKEPSIIKKTSYTRETIKPNNSINLNEEKILINKELIKQLFEKSEIKPNQGDAFLEKLDYWYKEHSPGGKNYKALVGGWNRLLNSGDLEVAVKILEKEGLPPDLIFQALGESYWTNTKSPKGASGVWQFMPDTSARFGVKNPGNIVELTKKAAEYMKLLKNLAQKCAEEAGVSISESDAWNWAFLAYNRGEGYVLRTPKGKKGDFFKYNGDVNEYIKNCKVKESINYPTKILGIRKASNDIFRLYMYEDMTKNILHVSEFGDNNSTEQK